MNNDMRRLRLELVKLEAEIAKLTKQAEYLRGTIAYFDERGETNDTLAPAKEIRNAIVALLSAEGKPLHYAEVYRRLQAQGITVNGKKPASNVGAHMSTDDRFESLGHGLWGLRRWSNSGSGDPLAMRIRQQRQDEATASAPQPGTADVDAPQPGDAASPAQDATFRDAPLRVLPREPEAYYSSGKVAGSGSR